MMKRIMAGLIGGVVFCLMISGSAFASGDEAYEHGGYYGGYYNDDAYEYGRARMVVPPPIYGNVVSTIPSAVYPPTNYRAAAPYYGHEGYEYSGGYGYYDDDRYEYRGGYYGHR